MGKSATANNAIEITSLSKKFGSVEAIKDISLYVPQGKIFGFLGPNGAGKTTTIRCLMDFIRPTTGSLKILGKDAQAYSSELKSEIGFLSSDTQLNAHWTGDDHINLFEQVKGSNKNAKSLITLLGLDTKAKVKNLSSGNKQKLAIILALIGNPKVLIMDEPTRGLDPVLQNELYSILKDFAAEGNTVFFSSHNLSEVQKICDIVSLIKSGKVVTEKTMDQIREMNVHIISVKTAIPIDRATLKIPGTKIVAYSKTDLTLSVKGDINPIIHLLTKKNIIDLNVSHATLEDIFLEQYKD